MLEELYRSEALDPLYTSEEMHSAEERYPGYPDTVPELMERAGKGVAERIIEIFPDVENITVVCGSGNNGGDGRVAARYLEEAGRKVLVVDAKPDDEDKDLASPDLLVDAIFGTGFTGEPRPGTAKLIEAINDLDVEVVAVDVPSAVNASTGEVFGAVVDAWCTVALHAEKVGTMVAPGSFHAGWTEVVEIGLELIETSHARVTHSILEFVPHRGVHKPETKYTAGSVLVVGGSPGMTGAVCLAAEAAFRADAGYVVVATPPESMPVIEARLLEAVKRPLDEVWEAVERASSLAIGPGLGRSDDRQSLVRRLLEETDVPAVVDADGLFELGPFEREAPTVLTPHSGELARLLDADSSWVDAHRLEAVQLGVERFGCVVLLKGDETIIASPDRPTLISGGSSSLATAGTGDVLTGIIGAFLAKGMDPQIAAAAAARVHANAAMARTHQAGLIASDVIAALPQALDGAI